MKAFVASVLLCTILGWRCAAGVNFGSLRDEPSPDPSSPSPEPQPPTPSPAPSPTPSPPTPSPTPSPPTPSPSPEPPTPSPSPQPPTPSPSPEPPTPSPTPSPPTPSPTPSPPTPSPSPEPPTPSPSPEPPTPSPTPEPPTPSPAPEPPSPSPTPQPPTPGPTPDPKTWLTLNHSPGYCAMYGICGKRRDGDVLNCPKNIEAPPPSEELAKKLQQTCPSLWAQQGGSKGKYCCTPEQIDKLATDSGKVAPFTVGCPACFHNFLHLWCVLSCSPDQATFTNVTTIQLAADNNATAVKEIDVWTSQQFNDDLFDSCKDVKFGAANLPAMKFMGGGAESGQQWLEFLGEVKDKRVPPVGSPFQQNFNPTGNVTPPGIEPATASFVTCGDPLFLCSCADCPVAPGCTTPHPGPPPKPKTCHVGAITCWDFVLLLTYIALVGGTAAVVIRNKRRRDQQLWEAKLGLEAQEPLLGMMPEQQAAVGATTGDQDEEDDETEPLPGDIHYPYLERRMQRAYTVLGEYCAQRPTQVIVAGVILIAFCLLGLIRFKLETNPQQLWVGPGSRAARDKANYEASFGPFYRVTQLILSTTPESSGRYVGTTGLPAIVTDEHIQLLWDMQTKVDALTATYDKEGARSNASLTDVCFKPFGSVCATQSILQYWQMNQTFYQSEQSKPAYKVRLTPDYCFGHWATQCRSAFEAPMDPHVILGGFSTGPDFRNYTADATAFVITYPINSNQDNLAAALAWESAFIELARTELSDMAAAAKLKLAFQAERSVEDELKRESYTDASVVAVSYLVMLAYIAAALAAIPPPKQFLQLFVFSRAGLGAAGVLIVAGSVAGAMGLCSMFGMWSTLIIMEVIPFLVLAVGVDNMFVLAHALARQDPSVPLITRAGLALGSAGPSITLAASCEVLAFGLGSLTPMPAVRNFSICAATAVLLDFILQVTVFMSLLVLDTKRLQHNRLDCLPCVRVPYLDASGNWVYDDVSEDEEYEPLNPGRSQNPDTVAGSGGWGLRSVMQGLRRSGGPRSAQQGSSEDPGEMYYAPQQQLLPAGDPAAPAAAAAATVGQDGAVSEIGVQQQQQQQQQRGDVTRGVSHVPEVIPGVTSKAPGLLHGEKISLQSLLQAYMERVHAPLLMQPLIQVLVVAVFITGLFVAAALIPRLSVGLDQAVALPRDSYMQEYYRDLMAYLRVGPPLYLVVSGVNVTAGAPDVNKLCSVAGCQQDSLMVRVSEASMTPSTTYIASPAASWIDDFLSWMNPSLPTCCRVTQHDSPQLGPAGSRCPPPDQEPCTSNVTACADCVSCLTEMPPGGRPTAEQVAKYLPWFLEAVPSEGCAKGGAGAYNNAIQKDSLDPTGIAGLSNGVITAAAFRTYHTPLNQQHDFIAALSAARAFTEKASQELGLQVYPYSVFHIFFEQYLDVRRSAALLVGLPLFAVFCVAWLFTGTFWGSAILLVMLLSLMLQLAGAMYMAGIEVNAVSLVNLAMALGIAVEFCAHILHSFCVSHGSRIKRAKTALIKMGAPVMSGITLTKFAGVIVLAFAQTQIFEVYYFRLYLALVILGAAHGLVLLPVVLSRIGPPSWSDRRLQQVYNGQHQTMEMETSTSGERGRLDSAVAAAGVGQSGGRPIAVLDEGVDGNDAHGERLPAVAATGMAAAAAALTGPDAEAR